MHSRLLSVGREHVIDSQDDGGDREQEVSPLTDLRDSRPPSELVLQSPVLLISDKWF